MMMKKEGIKKMKYSTPTVLVMEFVPGCILAGSAGPSGWSLDGSSGSGSAGASSSGWSIDDGDGGGTGASAGGWGIDGGSSGTGASTGSWSND